MEDNFAYCDSCVHARYNIVDDMPTIDLPYVCTEQSINLLSGSQSKASPTGGFYGVQHTRIDRSIIAKCKLMGVKISLFRTVDN